MTDRAMAPTDANAASDSMLWAFADVQPAKARLRSKIFTSVLFSHSVRRSCPSCVSPCITYGVYTNFLRHAVDRGLDIGIS